MVLRTRELESALGNPQKIIEANEVETSVIQRRCIRASDDLNAGRILTDCDLEFLRPCPAGAIEPFQLNQVIGKKLLKDISKGKEILWENIAGEKER